MSGATKTTKEVSSICIRYSDGSQEVIQWGNEREERIGRLLVFHHLTPIYFGGYLYPPEELAYGGTTLVLSSIPGMVEVCRQSLEHAQRGNR